MKRLIYLAFVSTFLFSCGGEENSKKETQEVKSKSEQVAITVDELLKNKPELAGKEVVFKGTVDHVCKHSGKRAFVFGSKEDIRIKIEAAGEITGFDAELIGQDIEVKGTLVETRLDEKYIAQLEGDLSKDAEMHVDGEGDHHEGDAKEVGEDHTEELAKKKAQIESLKKKIAASEKGYISNYHIDGISFKIVE